MVKNKQIKSIAVFENEPVRRVWNAEKEKWYFSMVDVVRILTESVDPGAYWRKLKERLRAEGSESVTKCHGLKMIAKDGKMRIIDTADTETLFRLIQSIPSPKAEPFKLWLAKVGYERVQEIEDPELATKRRGFNPLKKDARDGGAVAGRTRKDIEKQSGKKVVSGKNFLQINQSQKIGNKKDDKNTAVR